MEQGIKKYRKNDWENQHVLYINREPMHVPWGAYANEDEAIACDRRSSAFVRVLDGEWKFKLVDDPDQVPEEFSTEDFECSDWGHIKVPGNWELQGYDYPIYTCQIYPFKVDNPEETHVLEPGGNARELVNRNLNYNLKPPYVSRHNPTGCYKTTFEIIRDWDNREVFLSFEGVESAFYLWVNGEKVGYSQDSKLPAEFNITDFIRLGENTLAVQVMRWSDGIYLEDQDYWFLSGIHRSVVLFSKPRIHIRDFKVMTLLDDRYEDARLVAYCHVNLGEYFANYHIQAKLLNGCGNEVISSNNQSLA